MFVSLSVWGSYRLQEKLGAFYWSVPSDLFTQNPSVAVLQSKYNNDVSV